MKFYYKKLGPDLFRPIIPINLIYRNKEISYEVLIDSGADFSIFDSEIAEVLGIVFAVVVMCPS